MILIDYSQVFLSSLMANLAHNSGMVIEQDLIRHMVLSTILFYKKKFGNNYGEVIFCCDDRKYWRKGVFQNYKAGRKKMREQSGLDWKVIFETLEQMKMELQTFFPYKVLQVSGAEADDIIGVLAEYSQTITSWNGGVIPEAERVMIVSGDGDFLQLQKWDNIEQWSPILKKMIRTNTPERYLKEHIIRGDRGDGIPNFLSPDDTFVTPGNRAKQIRKDKLAKWIEQDPEKFCEDEVTLSRYRRNEQLIDLSKVPEHIKEGIVQAYINAKSGDRKKLFNYFVQNKLKHLMENIGDF